jgi:hypothetical protein
MKTQVRQRRWVFLSAVRVLFVVAVFAVPSAFSQTQNKILEWSKHPVGNNNERAGPEVQMSRQIETIEIEDVLIGGRSIKIGEAFAADIDWLRDITFRVKNISGEQLMGIQLNLTLPEVNKSPQIVFFSGCGHDNDQKCLMPGDEVELRMPRGHFYDWVKEIVAKEKDLSTITKAMIREMIVTLPSGIRWVSGCITTADPKNTCPHPLP